MMAKTKDHSPSQVPLVPIEEVSSLDEAEDKALARRFAGGEEVAYAYLYAFEQAGLWYVGANVDFVIQFVRQVLNRSGVQLEISEEPPVIMDFTLQGRPYVRAMVCAVDRRTGERNWAVKEEPRGSRHAATIALEKAKKKALESHPAYDRKKVARYIDAYLRRQGLESSKFVIAGSVRPSEWAPFFGRAKQAGIAPEEVRAAVRDDVGKGLSEVSTSDEASRAAAAVDRLIDAKTGDRALDVIKATCKEIIAKTGMADVMVKWLWHQVGSRHGTVRDFLRLKAALEIFSTGSKVEDAATLALEKFPKTDDTRQMPLGNAGVPTVERVT